VLNIAESADYLLRLSSANLLNDGFLLAEKFELANGSIRIRDATFVAEHYGFEPHAVFTPSYGFPLPRQ
jgi:hypothetical protein